MKIAINQPYFFPYIGYWQLIDSAEVFAIADNYNYIKNGWISRNRVLDGDLHKIRYFNIEIENVSQNRLINEHWLKPLDKEKKLAQLNGYYRRAPYKKECLELVEYILSCEERNLAAFLHRSIQILCNHLNIDTKIVRTSDYDQSVELRKTDRIVDYCRQIGADEYHNLIGGSLLYSNEEFASKGIELYFIDSIPYPYTQSGPEFIFGLSIIDILMNNSPDRVQDILKSYRLFKK